MTNNKINYINLISKEEKLLCSSAKVTKYYGEIRGSKFHQGIDYRVDIGTPVYSVTEEVIYKNEAVLLGVL